MVSPVVKDRIEKEIAAVLPDVVRFRHERHQTPELTWKEEETSQAVAEALKTIPGVDVKTGIARYGLVGVIEGQAGKGPTVALRSDMDALPVHEETGASYASSRAGVMHACGHDGHMANLLGAARVIASMRDELRGRVKILFQPAEEGGGGGRVMCEEGALDDPTVDVIFGLHGWPELPCGEVGVRSGALLASTSDVSIQVTGTGCHAAMPHLGTDQILAASRIVDALQSVVSREIPPVEPAALSITQIHGGSTHNVLPSEVRLSGTLRTTDVQLRERLGATIRRVAEHTAKAHGAEAHVTLKHGYPPTVNTAAETDYLERAAQAALGHERVHRMPRPTMGGEDFAYYLERVPGSFFFLGVSDGREGGYPSLHHPAYDFNDEALAAGMRVFAHAALGYGQNP